MTLFHVLQHQWRRWWRSPTRGRSLLATGLLLLAGTYFGLLFVGLGWLFPEMVSEVAPGREPLPLLNEYLLLAFVLLVASRFLLQRSAGSDIRQYLSLPVAPSRLVGVMQVTSALSLFNLLPALTLAAFWGSTVAPAVSPAGAVCWAVGVLLALALTEFANSLLRVAWDRHAGLVLAGGAIVVGVGVVGYLAGGEWVRAASGWLFGGMSSGQLVPVLGLAALTVGAGVAAHWGLRGRLYDVLEARGEADTGGPWFAGVGREQRGALALAFLDLKLILRNKRPRQMLLVVLPLIAYFFFVQGMDGGLTPLDQLFIGFFGSGMLGLTYSQFSYAWHGHHFDVLLTRAIRFRTLVRAQLATFAILCVGPVLIILPIVAGIKPTLVSPLGSLALYNVGVAAPIYLGFGMWVRTPPELNQSTFFNYQGTSSYHFFIVLPVMGVPIALLLTLGLSTTLLVLAGLGAVGIGTVPLWTRGIGRLLRGQRHAMAAGFRSEQ